MAAVDLAAVAQVSALAQEEEVVMEVHSLRQILKKSLTWVTDPLVRTE